MTTLRGVRVTGKCRSEGRKTTKRRGDPLTEKTKFKRINNQKEDEANQGRIRGDASLDA